MYKHYQPPELSVYAVDSDSGSACGLRRLAQAAGQGFKSPVFRGLVRLSQLACYSQAEDGNGVCLNSFDFMMSCDVTVQHAICLNIVLRLLPRRVYW